MSVEDEGKPELMRYGTPAYRRALTALFAIGIATFAQLYSIQPLLHQVGQEFDVAAGQTSWLMSSTTITVAIFVLVWGVLAERIGARTIIIGGLAIATLTAIGVGIAPNWSVLVGLRFLQGIALAGPTAATLAWVARKVEPTAVTKVSGLYIAGSTVGGMTGRLMSGFVTELTNWRGGLLTVAAFAAIMGALAHFLLPRAKGRKIVRQTVFEPDTSWRRSQRFGSYVFAFVGMGMFVGVFNVLGYRIALPPWSLGPGIGSMLFLSYIAGTVASSKAGDLTRRFGSRRVMLLGWVTMAIGLALTIPNNLITLWIGLFVLCAGFFGNHTIASSRATRLHPRSGSGSGMYLMGYYGGSSLGGIALGYAWDAGQWTGTLLAAAASLVVVLVVILFIQDQPKDTADAVRQ